MKTRIAAFAIVALILLGLALRPTRVDVDTATVRRDSLSVTVPAEGRTRARDRYRITAPNQGRITRIDVEVGDSIAAGTRIAWLHPLQENPQTVAQFRSEWEAAQARHREAEATLAQAQDAAMQAEREWERRRPLAEAGIITPEQAEQAETAARVAAERSASAEAAVTAAASAAEAARARLLSAEGRGDVVDEARTALPITAPVSGRVVSLPEPSARVVGAGEALLEIGTTDAMEIDLEVLSEDAVRIEVGAPVTLTRWGGPRPLRGHVRHLTRVGETHISTLGVEEQRVTVYAVLDEPEPSLGVGYRVSGEITVWQGVDEVVIPAGSWFLDTTGPQLFVVEGGRARLRSIELGERNDRVAVVTAGLEIGDVVVVYPPDELADGVRVRARDPGSSP